MPLKVDNMTTHGPSLTRVHDNDKVIDTDTDFSTELANQEESLSSEQIGRASCRERV